MQLVYLPAYSPDLNPIEEVFSCIKAWIRQNHDYVLGELDGHPASDPYQIFWEAVYGNVDAEKAYGWFCHSGYIA
ncbi:hypothetical protein L208DRAFT_1268999 [Tricholoma matsutake]|nr:hypothetical protein L208DRAFT_1268999 [Tricholoma matsutake 945]